MQCPYHSRNRVIGYCHVCGGFGCEECLSEHEGAFYCAKHFKPIGDELAKKKKHEEALTRMDRQRLVVHRRDGRTLPGICRSLNTASDGFYLELVDERGALRQKQTYVAFQDVKAIFYVKSFDGNFDAEQYPQETNRAPGSTPIVVEFEDGEILQARTFRPYRPEDRRFKVIPEDVGSNNVSILVECAAVKRVYSIDEYKEHKHRDVGSYLRKHKRGGLSRDELLGDFHFENHQYNRALKHYRIARQNDSESPRLLKKIIAVKYNIGTRQIKSHDYHRALHHMNLILQLDPNHERAKRKAAQLRNLIDRRESPNGQRSGH